MAQLSNIAMLMAMLTMSVMMSMTKVMMAIFEDKFMMIVVLIKRLVPLSLLHFQPLDETNF